MRERTRTQKTVQSDPTPLQSAEHKALQLVQTGAGQPLEAVLQNAFNPNFQFDFSRVQIFADDKAAEAANAVAARAYTVGQNIVFNRGEWNPDTSDGRFLLAHELAHTLQFDHFGAPISGLGGAINHQGETEANDFARAAVHGTQTPIQAAPTAAISRFPLGLPLPAPSSANAPMPSVPTASPQTFSFTLAKHEYSGLDAAAATAKLAAYRESLRSDITADKRIHRELRDNREAHSIVGFWSDTLGGASLPDYERWDEIESRLFEAKLAIEHKPLDETRVRRAEAALNQSETEIDTMMQKLGHYSKDTVKGAERGVSGLEKVRDTSKVAVDVMSGGKLGALYGGAQQLAQQGSELAYGQRDGLDLKSIAVNVATDYISGKIAGKIGAGKAVEKLFGASGVKSVAGKVAGEVVNQKLNSAVGIATNAVVSNVAGLENAPSLLSTGSSILSDLMHFDPEDMLKNYALGKLTSSAVESHKNHYASKVPPGQAHPVAHDPPAPSSSAAQPPHATTEPAAQPGPSSHEPAKGLPPIAPQQLPMILASLQASMTQAQQLHAALEQPKSSAVHAEHASHPTSESAPEPASSIPATTSRGTGPHAELAPMVNPHPQASVTPPGGVKPPAAPEFDNEPTQVRKNPVPKQHPFDDDPSGDPTRFTRKTGTYAAVTEHDLHTENVRTGLESVADHMHKTFGDELQHVDKLSPERRLEIMEAQNQSLNRNFTADHEGTGRAEAPDLYFRRGQPDSWLGQAIGPKNLIELNNTAPENAQFSGALGGGLAGTQVHEFAHIQQNRQAMNPAGYIMPRFGRMAAREIQNIHQPGITQEEFNRYYDQPLERDARNWDWTYKKALEHSPNRPDPAIMEAFSDQPTLEMPAINPAKPEGQPSTSRRTPPGGFGSVSDEEIGALVGGLEEHARAGNLTELPSTILHDPQRPGGSRLREQDLFSPELLPTDHPGARPIDQGWEPSSLPSKPLPGSGTSLSPGIVQNLGDAVSKALTGARDLINKPGQTEEPAPMPESDSETAARVAREYMARAGLTEAELAGIEALRPESGLDTSQRTSATDPYAIRLGSGRMKTY